MTLDDRSPRPRRVAVGDTREAAAAAFGAGHDDLFVTAYDDVEREVDLTAVESLDLVPGTGTARLLERAARELADGHDLTLRLAAPDGAGRVPDLASHGLVITRVELLEDVPVLTLARGEQPRAGHDDVVLQALAAARAPVAPTPVPERTAEAPVAAGKGPRRRPEPELVRLERASQRWRRGRRRTALLAAAAAGAVVVLVLALLAADHAVALALLVTLLAIAVLGGLAALLVLVLALARQVHGQTGRLERMALRNREVVRNRVNHVGGRLRTLEQGQARLPFAQDYLEAVAEASAETSTRLRDLMQSLGALGLDAERLMDPHRELHLETQRQVQALLGLERMLDLPGRVAPMGGWAASPDFNLLVLQELLRVRPAVVLECGSGTSTLLMALAVRQFDLPTRIVSLEHLEQFRHLTCVSLAENGVDHLVDVRVAPLAPTGLPGHATPWYDVRALEGLGEVGMVVVDGPPELTGEHARYPVVPLLQDRLADEAVVVIDDLKREGDREVVALWRELLPDFEFERIGSLQKHAGVLRRHAVPGA